MTAADPSSFDVTQGGRLRESSLEYSRAIPDYKESPSPTLHNTPYERVRENMKVLKGAPLTMQYTRTLSDQEKQLEELLKTIDEFDAKEKAAQQQLDRAIQDLAFDTDL
jgi:hypothetical protein